MKRRADLEGRRLLAVRAAENVGFWYAANLEDGVGGPRVSIATKHCYLFRLFCACLLACFISCQKNSLAEQQSVFRRRQAGLGLLVFGAQTGSALVLHLTNRLFKLQIFNLPCCP